MLSPLVLLPSAPPSAPALHPRTDGASSAVPARRSLRIPSSQPKLDARCCALTALLHLDMALGFTEQLLLLWGCRFGGTAMGVAACQGKIHPELSCGALWDPPPPCHPLSEKQVGSRGARPGRAICSLLSRQSPLCFYQHYHPISPAALSLLYIYRYYQLILQSPSVGLLILPSDLREAATLYIPAPSPAPPSPDAMFN